MPSTQSRALVALIGLLAYSQASDASDPWAPVTDILQSFQNLSNCSKCRGFAFTAGNASGRQYSFAKGQITHDKPLVMASASKFPAALAIAGAVNDGFLGFDTFAHEVFDWWSSDPSDPRSGVTLGLLLSFRSGFYWADPSSGNCSCMTLPFPSDLFSPEQCAHQIYKNAPFKYAPGSTWAYNSFHLQVAGAMAAKAAGVSLVELLDKYLIAKLGLKHTGWLLGRNPMLAASMYTTSDDYDKILRSYLSYELVPKHVADVMEVDYIGNTTKLCDWCPELADSLGHYSMANWYECVTGWHKPNSSFSERCRVEKVHMDAGLFGYYPLFDRAKGMYMQISQSIVVGINDDNPGMTGASELRLLVKPAVDKALGLKADPPAGPGRRPPVDQALWSGFGELPWSEWEEIVDRIAY
eukprot:TRINITY_DN3759_c0_g1_i3.p1 TRINITY_DN3759_c0_g1~~TRINITY_DN3759_c0_g1_i3.p1  ORF type:complete len:411 (-),score=75.74 TRINITY_DN3759_c0_g1_i3:227-1459(-)